MCMWLKDTITHQHLRKSSTVVYQAELRIENYQTYKVRADRVLLKCGALIAVTLDVGEEAIFRKVMQANKSHVQVQLLMLRAKFIRIITSKFNILSRKACPRNSRFKMNDIFIIMNMIQWYGSTESKRYRCDPMTATHIFLHILACNVRC